MGICCDRLELILIRSGILILLSSLRFDTGDCWWLGKDLDHVVDDLLWFLGHRFCFSAFVDEVCMCRDCDLVVDGAPDAILVAAAISDHDPFSSARIQLLVLGLRDVRHCLCTDSDEVGKVWFDAVEGLVRRFVLQRPSGASIFDVNDGAGQLGP